MSDFISITSNDNWFKKHPEKIAGIEYHTSSIFFPIQVKGTKEDVLRVTGMMLNSKPDTRKLEIAKAKAKALKIKLMFQKSTTEKQKMYILKVFAPKEFKNEPSYYAAINYESGNVIPFKDGGNENILHEKFIWTWHLECFETYNVEVAKQYPMPKKEIEILKKKLNKKNTKKFKLQFETIEI